MGWVRSSYVKAGGKEAVVAYSLLSSLILAKLRRVDTDKCFHYLKLRSKSLY